MDLLGRLFQFLRPVSKFGRATQKFLNAPKIFQALPKGALAFFCAILKILSPPKLAALIQRGTSEYHLIRLINFYAFSYWKLRAQRLPSSRIAELGRL